MVKWLSVGLKSKQEDILTTKRKPNVLVVDDEAAILHSLGMFLEEEGYSVETIARFDTYRAAMLKKELPDVIVLDILLNQEDGLKIASELKSDPKTKAIPIIMISALPDGERLSKKAGAEAFLGKPFDVEDLDKTITELTAK